MPTGMRAKTQAKRWGINRKIPKSPVAFVFLAAIAKDGDNISE